VADFSRQKMTLKDFKNLIALARELELEKKIQEMFQGKKINQTENRPVLHVALRAPASHVINVSGENVVSLVHGVLNKIYTFSEAVRSGT
jgi:glucose-6-phosphate isomerase